jgi:hypothetical protein
MTSGNGNAFQESATVFTRWMKHGLISRKADGEGVSLVTRLDLCRIF